MSGPSDGDDLPPARRAGGISRRLQALDPTRDMGDDADRPMASGVRAPLRPHILPRQTAQLPARRSATVPARLPPAQRLETSGGRGDWEFSPHALDVVDAPRSPVHWQVVAALTALIVAALLWSTFGRMAVFTTAPGKIQATGRTKVLESFVTGEVTKILVHDGDRVKEGDVLVELDPTDARAVRTIVYDQLTDQRAESLRETTGIKAARVDTIDPRTKIAWTDAIPVPVRKREDAVLAGQLDVLASTITTLRSQRTEKERERDKDEKSVAAQKALIAVTQENVGMIQTLLDGGYNSRAQYLDMKAKLDQQQVTLADFEGDLAEAKQAITLIDAQIAKARETFIATNTQASVSADQKIVDLEQQLVKADQTLSNMTLHSPVSGTIHASAVTTIGQIVKSRQQLMQIVPSDAGLEIQAYVDNTDIGFIHVGQAATIKLTSFNYGTYGSIDGTVTDVARDAVSVQQKATTQDASLDGEYAATTAAQKTGNLQFPVTVKAARNTMNVDGKDVPLIPGMTVSVDLETEQRPGLDYIVTPIRELLSTAAHEK